MHRYPRPRAGDFFDLSRPANHAVWTRESRSSDAITDSIYQPTHSEFQCPTLHTHQNSTPPLRGAPQFFGVPQTTPFERPVLMPVSLPRLCLLHATSAPHSGAPLQFHDNSTPRKPRHFYVWVAS
ncbi:hypothetical protein C8J57DRAFT_1232417 [Mycena rebaudengoi]|nr:hypothetical protein C8J57DRAFT_1245171 [Mycena rebaudengoi]KAJ7261560.1 hypothetical protein C8J57DRAFT_1232417 [Mycena rebaudengoi]